MLEIITSVIICGHLKKKRHFTSGQLSPMRLQCRKIQPACPKGVCQRPVSWSKADFNSLSVKFYNSSMGHHVYFSGHDAARHYDVNFFDGPYIV